MELFSVMIGVAIGLALAGVGISGAKILAWAEAKIKLVEAQTESHKAVASVTNARAQVISSAGSAGVSAAVVPTVPSGPKAA